MSATGRRIDWWEAFCVGTELMQRLDGAYERIGLAGSIRRGKEAPNDIDIVLIPNANTETRLARLVLDGVLSKVLHPTGKNRKPAPRWGEKAKFAEHVASGIAVQFFAATRENWGYQYLLRTGPGDANEVLVTCKGLRNRHGDIGVLPHDLRFFEGYLWRMPEATTQRGDKLPPGCVRIDTPEEIDVFRAMGIGYLLPPDRTILQYQSGGSLRYTRGSLRGAGEDCVYSPLRQAWKYVPPGGAFDPANLITRAKAMRGAA